MYIYYKYAPNGKMLLYLKLMNFLYWYTSEALGKWYVYTIVKIYHVNFLTFAHWFMSIRISQINYHSISVDQARYDTSTVAKYLNTSMVKKSTKFFQTTLPYDMIFINDDVSTSDEQVEMLSR